MAWSMTSCVACRSMTALKCACRSRFILHGPDRQLRIAAAVGAAAAIVLGCSAFWFGAHQRIA
ncbi:hypothetical protein ALP24_02685 [Pseudomonas syringae pv. aptata]|uniref:Uncharacterized protein n=1 Tax=Pseudomonas syringae pv. aptata TaxID=83167 RepID=A0A3M5WD63_PSEAP|nr:hypothetical protein ALP24_02685 [Pseudomonas syringae pv. aptata]